jgi:hypothetical protein
MATIAVSSAKGAVVDPGEGGRSAALSWGTPALTFCVLGFNLYQEVSAM